MKSIQEKWRACGEKPLMIVIALALFISMFSIFARSLSKPLGAASDQDASSDYSFYRLSETAAAALSTAMADKDEPDTKLGTYFGSITPASAGGLLGYTSKDNNRGVWGMFMSALSLGANTKEYSSMGSGGSALVRYVGNTSGTLMPYASLGTTMNLLGLDKSSSGAEFGESVKRTLFGMVAQVAFQLSTTVTVIFGFAVDVLKFFNPFQFFNRAGNYQTITFDGFVDEMAAIKGESLFGMDPSSVFAPVIDMVSKFWDILHVTGIIFAGIALFVIIVKFFMPGSFGRLEGLRKWFIQALFVIGGIAILGGTYTMMLGWLDGMTESGNTAAIKVIGSTFFDFETWAMHGMPVADGLSLGVDYDKGTLSSTTTDVQTVCLKMNTKANPSQLGGVGDMGLSSDPTEIYGSMVNSVQNMYDSAEMSSGDAISWAFDMLDRYMSGSRVYSSSYESAWKAKYWASGYVGRQLAEYINYSDDVDSILSSSPIYSTRWTGQYAAGVPNPFAPGTGNTEAWTGNMAGSVISGLQNLSPTTTAHGEITSASVGNLSAMSVYNYLNTTFGPSSITVYSSENSSSEFVRDMHYSVNLVGAGWNSFVVFALCVLLLVTYAILGFFYGFSIIMANVTRGFRMIMAVPGAMLGSLQSIAKVVSYTVLMIVEVLATIFLYCVTSEVLFVLMTVVTNGFQRALSSLFQTAVLAIMSPIIGIIACVFLIWFTWKAISLRKPVVGMFEEIADNVIQKFILGNQYAGAAGNRGGGGGAGAVAAGAAAGTAAAAAKPRRGMLGKIQSANDRSKAESEMRISQMFGMDSNSSAVGEERVIEQHKMAKQAAKSEARMAKVEAGKKAIVGAAEVSAGVATGNALLAARGAQNIVQGGADLDQADINRNARIAASAHGASGALGQADVKTGGRAAASYQQVQKMDLANEAQGAAQAAMYGAGTMPGAAAAGASNQNLAGGPAGGGGYGPGGYMPVAPQSGAGTYSRPQDIAIPGGDYVAQDPNNPNLAVQVAGGQLIGPGYQPGYQPGQQSGLLGIRPQWQGPSGNPNGPAPAAPANIAPTYVHGLDGQVVQVPGAGQNVVDLKGNTTIARVGPRDVIYHGETGQIPMHLNDNGSWSAGASTASTAETLRVTKQVNTVVASEMNARAVASGSGQRYTVDDKTGAVIPVTERTVNGRDITNLNTADEVRRSGRAGSAKLPSTPLEVNDTLRQATQHEVVGIDAMTSIRREQSGQIVDMGANAPADVRVPGTQTRSMTYGTNIDLRDESRVTQSGPKTLQEPGYRENIITDRSLGSQNITRTGEARVDSQVKVLGGRSSVDGQPGGQETVQLGSRQVTAVGGSVQTTYVSGMTESLPVYGSDNGVGGVVVPHGAVTSSAIQDKNIVRRDRITEEQFGSVYESGLGSQAFGQPQGETGYARVSDQLHVGHDQSTVHGVGSRVDSGFGGGGSAGSSGSYRADSVEDRIDTEHHEIRNEYNAGSFGSGGGRSPGVSPTGSTETARVDDQVNIQRRRTVNHQDGGSYDAGGSYAGSVSAMGRRETLSAADETVIQQQRRVVRQDAGVIEIGGSQTDRGSYGGHRRTERVTDETVVNHEGRVIHQDAGISDPGYTPSSGTFGDTHGVAQETDDLLINHLVNEHHETSGVKVGGLDGLSSTFADPKPSDSGQNKQKGFSLRNLFGRKK